jgi:hypothetical protein
MKPSSKIKIWQERIAADDANISYTDAHTIQALLEIALQLAELTKELKRGRK